MDLRLNQTKKIFYQIKIELIIIELPISAHKKWSNAFNQEHL